MWILCRFSSLVICKSLGSELCCTDECYPTLTSFWECVSQRQNFVHYVLTFYCLSIVNICIRSHPDVCFEWQSKYIHEPKIITQNEKCRCIAQAEWSHCALWEQSALDVQEQAAYTACHLLMLFNLASGLAPHSHSVTPSLSSGMGKRILKK